MRRVEGRASCRLRRDISSRGPHLPGWTSGRFRLATFQTEVNHSPCGGRLKFCPMRYRLLGTTAGIVAAVLVGLPSPAAGQSCPGLLAAVEAGEATQVLWVGESMFSEPLDSACAEHADLVEFLRRKLKPREGCSSLPPMTSWADTGAPILFKKALAMTAFTGSSIVVVGVVEATVPGIEPARGVTTYVRVRASETLRADPDDLAHESYVSFLEPGGSLSIDGRTHCTNVPPYAREWHVGDRVLVAGGYGQTSDPTFVSRFASAFLIQNEVVSPPDSSPYFTGSLPLESVRAALRGTTAQ